MLTTLRMRERSAAPRRAAPQSLALASLVALSGSPLGAGACDLKADFIAPTGASLAGAQPLTWTLRFTNIGSAGDCSANQVTLYREASSTNTSSLQIGSAGPPQPLPALAPKASATLTFQEGQTPSSGTHVYKLSYATAFRDADARNHHPTRKVSFQATYTLSPSSGQ